MSRPLRVFLCHASQDKPAVRELYNALKSEGWIDPWLDKAKILPGQDWEMVIEKAVEDSDAVVICLSSRSVSKEGFVQREIRYAYDIALEKPEETIFLIPLRLDDCNVPRKLRSFHWVDYFGSEKKSSYSDLLESLKLRYEQKLGLEDGGDEHEIADPKKQNNASKGLVDKVETQDFFDTLLDAILKYGKPWIWFGGIFLLGLLFWGISALLNREPAALPEQTTATITATITPTLPTRTPTATRTPVPPTFTPTPGIGSIYLSEGVTMLYVPAGTFSMGSETFDDERPIHAVNLNAFYMDKYEVTNAAYKRCVEAGVCDPPTQSLSSTRTAYYGNPEFDEYPVIYVDWNMAKTYCEWRGVRLPTEAEWEKAARGTDGRTYPWGNAAPKDTLLNYTQNVGDTTKVGYYLDGVSPYGMYDMAGNVWEWVNDWYDPTYYQTSPSSNPQGPTSGQSRVLRGGSWYDFDSDVRSANRVRNDSTVTFNGSGFRCSLSHP